MSAAIDRHRARVREYLEGAAPPPPPRSYYDPQFPEARTAQEAASMRAWAEQAKKSSVPLWQAALDAQRKAAAAAPSGGAPYYGPDVHPATGEYAPQAQPHMVFSPEEVTRYERAQAAKAAPKGPSVADLERRAAEARASSPYFPAPVAAPPTAIMPGGFAPMGLKTEHVLLGAGILGVVVGLGFLLRGKRR